MVFIYGQSSLTDTAVYLPAQGQRLGKTQCQGCSNSMIIFPLCFGIICAGVGVLNHAGSSLALVMASHGESGNQLWGWSQGKTSTLHEGEAQT